MESVNDLLRDEAIRHQVALQGLSNNVVARIIATLNRSDKRILAELAEKLESLDASSFSMERLESLLTSIRSMSVAAYGEIDRELTKELREFVAYETAYQQQMLAAHVPVGVHVASVAPEAVYAAAMSRPFQGVLLREVWREMDANKMRKVRQAIASGFVEGKTTDQIIRELRGTKVRGYADGLLEVNRRDAEAVTRTALGHMARFAQDKTVEANADLIKALVWSATLDLRTTPICRVRDGKKYTTAHKPIGHSLPWVGGPGNAHWRCRSHATYVLKSNEELGIDAPEVVVVGKTRASMDGQVPAETDYSEWLKAQTPARQDQVLGPTRGALFRAGNLPLERMYSQNGRLLTLEQMRAQDSDVFRRAGVDADIKPPRGQQMDSIAAFLRDKNSQNALLSKLYTQEGMSYQGEISTVKRIAGQQGYTASLESLSAVRFYTGDAYNGINRRMRETGGTLADRQFTALTSSGLEQMPPFKGPVYRAPVQTASAADEWWSRAAVGEEFDVGKQLLSFSSSSSVAKDWGRNSDVLLKLDNAGPGVYIEPLSLYPGENEVLLPLGQRFAVSRKSTEYIDGQMMRIIELRILKK